MWGMYPPPPSLARRARAPTGSGPPRLSAQRPSGDSGSSFDGRDVGESTHAIASAAVPSSSRQSQSLMGVRGERTRNLRRRWLPTAVACVAVSLLPVSAVGAAEEPAGADEPASDAQAAAEASADGSAGGVEVVRYAGSDQYELSLAVAQDLVDADGGTSEWVVLASGESWADAATAGPLAASLGAPVVLVPPGGLQTATARPGLVKFLRSSGVRRVVIVGGPDVLPNHEPSVLYGLGMLPRNVERVQSADPVGTSIAVAKRSRGPAELGELGRTVIIANDESVADAVAVGPLAAAGPFPLLLTAPDALDPHIATYLTEQEVAHVVLVGGTAAIASEVQEAIEAAGPAVTRLAGRDRSDTARFAADLFEQHTADGPACKAGPIRIGLTPAQHPEPALTAGPLLAQACAPLRYTEPATLPPELHHDLFVAQSRVGSAELHVFASATELADDVLNVSVPPVRIAAWRLVAGEPPAGSQAVLIVSDGRTRPRVYPQATVDVREPDGNLQLPRPSWGPHGRYLTYRDPATEGVLLLDTVSERIDLVRYGDEVPELLVGTGISWSPDGSRLIFSAIIDDESTLSDGVGMQVGHITPELTAELFLYDVPSGEVSRMTHNARTDVVLSWSDNGTEVVHGSTRFLWPIDTVDALWSISIENVESGEISVFPHQCLDPWGLSRSPDDSRILLTGLPNGCDGYGWPGQVSEIYVIDSDGGNLRQLTPSNCADCFKPRYGKEAVGPNAAFNPSWSPEGDKALYWVWIRADEGLEASLQVHEFASGKGRVLLSFGPDDVAARGRVLGWANKDELFYWTGPCDDRSNGQQRPDLACVARIDVNSGSIRHEFEVPSRPFAGSLEQPRSVSLSEDRQHFAARYANAGLYVYSLHSRRWTAVVDPWSAIGGLDERLVGGCFAYWTDIGFLGRCDEILDDED